MKIAIFFVLMLSLPAIAIEITCTGQTIASKLVLSLTEKAFPLHRADYSYNGKLIPTSGYEFGIAGDKNDAAEKLTYKFLTLKRHKLASKKSHLVFTITENGTDKDPFLFVLSDSYKAQLVLEENGLETLLDHMNCTTTKL